MNESPDVSSARAGGWWPEILAVVAPIFFSVGALGTSEPLPPDSVTLGFLQYDQPSYYACAREVFENGNFFFAGSPWSSEPGSPRIYTNLTFSFFGLLWKLGIPIRILDAGIRVVFGMAMMLLLVRLIRAALPSTRAILAACALVLFGGGLAWLFALWRFVTDTLFNRGVPGIAFSWESFVVRYPGLHADLERGYADWHQSIFRSLTYAPETFYHTLFFGCMLTLVNRAWRCSLVLLFLTWWAHPFTGIEAGFIFSAFTFLEGIILKRMPRWPFLGALAIHAIFFTYYGLLLPLNPEHASVAEQVRAFGNPMLISMLIPAYGLLLPIALSFLCMGPARALLRISASARLMLCWLVCVTILVFHDRILFFMEPMQPMHFTRGYLYVPLVFWAACAFDFAMPKLAARKRWLAPVIGLLFLAVHLPDNLIALGRQRSINSDSLGVFYRPKACLEFYEKLNAIEEPLVLQSVWTMNPWPRFDYLIPVYTHHRTLVGHWANTPYKQEKAELLRELEMNPSRASLRKTGLTGILTDAEGVQRLREILAEDEFESVVELEKLHCIIIRLDQETARERTENPIAILEGDESSRHP